MWQETKPKLEIEIEDPVVQEVIEKLATRSARGMKDYGISMEDNPASIEAWIDHAVEELLDAANYLTKLKRVLYANTNRPTNK